MGFTLMRKGITHGSVSMPAQTEHPIITWEWIQQSEPFWTPAGTAGEKKNVTDVHRKHPHTHTRAHTNARKCLKLTPTHTNTHSCRQTHTLTQMPQVHTQTHTHSLLQTHSNASTNMMVCTHHPLLGSKAFKIIAQKICTFKYRIYRNEHKKPTKWECTFPMIRK